MNNQEEWNVETVINLSSLLAAQNQNKQIEIEHVFAVLVSTDVRNALIKSLLSSLQFSPKAIQDLAVGYIAGKIRKNLTSGNLPTTSLELERVIELSKLTAANRGSSLEPEHLLITILSFMERNNNGMLAEIMAAFPKLTSKLIEEQYDLLLGKSKADLEDPTVTFTPDPINPFDNSWQTSDPDKEEEKKEAKAKKKEKPKTPALDIFCTDLSQLDREGKLDPIIGRHKEVERIVQVLSRKKKNNPVLIGEPGTGKTAIVEGLAMRINSAEVPSILEGKRILSLDLTSVVAGTKFRGEFEERIKAIIKELKENPDIIIFMDELHTLVGAGNNSGGMDAANILKPALARGEIKCIGATTIKEYRENIEKDGALERRFQKVRVEPTSIIDTKLILDRLADTYGDFHMVNYTEEALDACIKYSSRYIQDRHFPDKAIDILDEVGSRVNVSNLKASEEVKTLLKLIDEKKKSKLDSVNNEKYELAAQYKQEEDSLVEQKDNLIQQEKDKRNSNRIDVTDQHVAEVISSITGIPVTKVSSKEAERLKDIKDILKEKVIGQDIAVDKVIKSIKRGRLGFSDPNKPLGCFLFSGPTGVGKTQLAKVLSEELFNSKDSLIRIDMSEFTHKHEISKLIGSAPGFVGYQEGGRLTEAVRKNPYSVILLDEVEKAHKDVFNVFLQVFDDGILTDGLGRVANFKNTVFILTSNVGSREAQEAGSAVGFGGSRKELLNEQKKAGILSKALKKKFSPEFLNRLDAVVRFNSLTKENISDILNIELEKVSDRITSKNYSINLDKKAKNFLIEKGFKKEFGARPLKRALQDYVEDLLVDEILDNGLQEGETLNITSKKGDDFLSRKTKRAKPGESNSTKSEAVKVKEE